MEIREPKKIETETETESLYLFSDASFCQKSKQGVAGYMSLGYKELCSAASSLPHIQTSFMKEKSNIRMELRAAIDALLSVPKGRKATLYTDCQCVVNLDSRREKLLAAGFCNKEGERLKNADLYREFFLALDNHPARIIWIKGHRKKSLNPLENCFRQVDQKVRKELKEKKTALTL